jgi:hypothetical protein
MATSYKPSPLSYGSPRASPFRRPESPASPSPLRHSTPIASPPKMAAPITTTPSRLNRSSTPQADGESWTPRGLVAVAAQREAETSPTKGANSPGFGGMLTARTTMTDTNALSKLHPAQIRELREVFSVLDRDSDGQLGREDVADMLTQLGMLLPVALKSYADNFRSFCQYFGCHSLFSSLIFSNSNSSYVSQLIGWSFVFVESASRALICILSI